MRPDLGKIQNGVPELFGLLGSHGLHVDRPRGVIPVVDGLKQVLLRGIRVGTCKLTGLLGRQVLDTLVGDVVELSVGDLTLLADELEGVARVAVHVSPSIRSASISKHVGDLVERLGVLGQVVPEVRSVRSSTQVGLRISLLGVDEVGELDGVSDEEDGGVVGHHVPVTPVGSMLDGEASGSRAESAEPRSPPTVENRTVTGHL